MSTKSGIELIGEEAKKMSELHCNQQYDVLDEAELQCCAEAYLVAANSLIGDGEISPEDSDEIDDVWPFDDEAPKINHDDAIPNLARAGAFIVAEIDRLLRARVVSDTATPERGQEVPVSPPHEKAGDNSIDVPFLLSAGFKDLGDGFYSHECGVYYLEKDGTYSFGGLSMKAFESQDELRDFLKAYKKMSNEAKEINKVLIGVAKAQSMLNIIGAF